MLRGWGGTWIEKKAQTDAGAAWGGVAAGTQLLPRLDSQRFAAVTGEATSSDQQSAAVTSDTIASSSQHCAAVTSDATDRSAAVTTQTDTIV